MSSFLEPPKDYVESKNKLLHNLEEQDKWLWYELVITGLLGAGVLGGVLWFLLLAIGV